MFSGRIGRLGFFVGYLYLQVPLIAAIILYALFGALAGDAYHDMFRTVTDVVVFVFGVVWTILYCLIGIDLSVRRWHDINQTGLLVFLYVVPIASLVAAIVQLVVPGNPEANQYGKPVSGLGIKQVLFHKYATESQSEPAQPEQQ